jgi:peptidoglycan/LPS O-acetylase OafA/YrhL
MIIWLMAIVIVSIVAATVVAWKGVDAIAAFMTGPMGWIIGIGACLLAFSIGRRSNAPIAGDRDARTSAEEAHNEEKDV